MKTAEETIANLHFSENISHETKGRERERACLKNTTFHTKTTRICSEKFFFLFFVAVTNDNHQVCGPQIATLNGTFMKEP